MHPLMEKLLALFFHRSDFAQGKTAKDGFGA
jgi:hypothetical protein